VELSLPQKYYATELATRYILTITVNSITLLCGAVVCYSGRFWKYNYRHCAYTEVWIVSTAPTWSQQHQETIQLINKHIKVKGYSVWVFMTVRPVRECCLHRAALEGKRQSLKHTATAKRQTFYHIKLLQMRKTNVYKLLSNYLQMASCGWCVFANGYR